MRGTSFLGGAASAQPFQRTASMAACSLRLAPCRGLQHATRAQLMHGSQRAPKEEGQSRGRLTAPGLLSLSRRDLMGLIGASVAASSMATSPPAQAALVQFPANQLRNQYILVRAARSAGEEQGVMVTNPVWKTNGICGLTAKGAKQVYSDIIPALQAVKACDEGCLLWPSITANAYSTAEMIASSFNLGYSRIVPEYSFLDKRGLGALEDRPYDEVTSFVAEADSMDSRWRPVPGRDGTPHESIEDVLVRMRQMLSITETQYTGQDIVIISPDSYNLSSLQAAVVGVDLRNHDIFKFAPGEVRVLQLGSAPPDGTPRSFSCPDPPKCLQMGAPTADLPRRPVSLIP